MTPISLNLFLKNLRGCKYDGVEGQGGGRKREDQDEVKEREKWRVKKEEGGHSVQRLYAVRRILTRRSLASPWARNPLTRKGTSPLKNNEVFKPRSHKPPEGAVLHLCATRITARIRDRTLFRQSVNPRR